MTTSNHNQPAIAAPDGEVRQEWMLGDPLEPPEQELLDHALTGTRLDLAGDGPVDHQAMTEWGPARTVRGAVLRYLLVEPQWAVHSKGVQLRGMRISGRLDLESATVRCPLLFEDCYFDSPEPVLLDYATVPRIVLARCRVAGGLTAGLLVVTKELDLTGSVFEGAVRLAGADITGQLNCHGAQLTGKDSDGDALNGDGMKIGGNVRLRQVFTAAGAIRLLGADITGWLSCRGAKLTGKDGHGNALNGDGMKVGGDVFLDQGFTAAGAIRLGGADITGGLFCAGAQLNGKDDDGKALVGYRMKVGGDVQLDQEFTAVGAVNIAAANIGGSLWLSEAQLGEPVALLAGGLQIGGELQWAPCSPVAGLVDLERAAVHRLDDDWNRPNAHWPAAGRLRLAGFTYDGFSGHGQQASLKERLAWIRCSHTRATATTPAAFAAQPYEQLAKVYRQAGHEAEAQQVAIARRNDLRDYGNLTRPQKLGNRLLDITLKQGYQPLRAVVGLVVVYVLVVLGAFVAQHDDSVIVPAKSIKDIDPVPKAMQCSPGYPCFYPAGYAVDVVVPIINLRQAENWRVDGQASWGWAYLAAGWFAIGLGWAFTTLAVAGYTGLVRKE